MSRSSEDTVHLQFVPPMWQQRRSKVKDLIVHHKIREVCDLGCGSGGLLSELLYYKGMRTLIGIDLDTEALNEAREDCSPSISSYILKRKSALTVKILKGSILDATNHIPFQIACVTLCEVIEHVQLEDLAQLARSIFLNINPEYAIITTPNKDFNFYFPDPQKFRHYDHKFEWTQSEFRDWCEEVKTQYGYDYFLTGVGLPENCSEKGFCTQIAMFKRQQREVKREVEEGTFVELVNCMIPENYPVDFEKKFYYDFLYSLNVARGWTGVEYVEGVSLDTVFQVPSIAALCDGSICRLLYLADLILPKFELKYSIEDGKFFLQTDANSDED